MYETHNPVEDRFGFSAQGTFRCSKPTERISIIIITLSVVIVSFAWYAVLFHQLRWYFDKSVDIGISTTRTIGYIYVASEFFLIAAAYTAIHLIMNGNIYRYSADPTHFSVVSEKAGLRKTDIYYDDVVYVDYKEYYLFNRWLRGYTVTVVTRSLGSVRFEYLFNKSIPDKTPQNTPFRIIEERVAMITDNAAVYGR